MLTAFVQDSVEKKQELMSVDEDGFKGQVRTSLFHAATGDPEANVVHLVMNGVKSIDDVREKAEALANTSFARRNQKDGQGSHEATPRKSVLQANALPSKASVACGSLAVRKSLSVEFVAVGCAEEGHSPSDAAVSASGQQE